MSVYLERNIASPNKNGGNLCMQDFTVLALLIMVSLQTFQLTLVVIIVVLISGLKYKLWLVLFEVIITVDILPWLVSTVDLTGKIFRLEWERFLFPQVKSLSMYLQGRNYVL